MTRLWIGIPALLIAAGLFLVGPGSFARAQPGVTLNFSKIKTDYKEKQQKLKTKAKMQDIHITGRAQKTKTNEKTKFDTRGQKATK